MIIDINAYLGHWPFRQLRHNTVSGLLKLMDKNGIDKAVVSSINAIFYKNTHAGNEELAAETKRHRDRLIPFASLDPQYAGWMDDLKECHEKFGMTGLRLFPHYYDYSLNSGVSFELVQQAVERKMALSIPMRVVDRRQRHRLDNVGDISVSDVEALMRKFPQASFMILNGIGLRSSGLVRDEKLKSVNFLLDISRMSVVLQEEIPALMAALGPSKIAFGTGIPFKYPAPALLKVDILKEPEEVKEQIRWKNAARMLNIEPQ